MAFHIINMLHLGRRLLFVMILNLFWMLFLSSLLNMGGLNLIQCTKILICALLKGDVNILRFNFLRLLMGHLQYFGFRLFLMLDMRMVSGYILLYF